MRFLSTISKTRYFSYLFLLVGTIHGLIYVFIMPPWQHYDEPGHFEYVWMIANSPSIPEKGMVDNSIRLKMLQSMKEHNFFNSPSLNELSKVAAAMDPVWIGVTQVGDPPLYYWLAALPLRLFLSQPVDFQLYVTRLVSLLLWLGVLYISWLFTKEITPANHPLRWMLPNSLALLPAFVEHSTALNNDIGATFVYSLIILFSTRLIKNGFKNFNILIVLGLLVISYFTKASIWLSFVAVPLAIFFTLVRNRNSKLVIGSLILAAVVGWFIIFEFGDVALWFRDTTQAQPTRVETEFGPAIQIFDNQSSPSNTLMQEVITPVPNGLSNKKVTLGVWMWGKENLSAYPPSIMVINEKYQREYLRPEAVPISSTPSYFSNVYQIPEKYRHLYLVLQPLILNDKAGYFFYQNPILVQGDCTGDDEPVLSDQNHAVECNGQAFENLVRNSDFEMLWPKFRSNIIDMMSKIDYRISAAANSIIFSLDGAATFWYTRQSVANIFRSFWGKFGWGQILWVGGKPYILPLIFTIIGIIPGFYGIVKNIPKYKFFILFWFGFAAFCIFFYAWFTGISMESYFLSPNYPDARYMFPAVLILMGIIASGWELIISSFPIRVRKYGYILYFLFFIYLDFLSIYTIQKFYGLIRS